MCNASTCQHWRACVWALLVGLAAAPAGAAEESPPGGGAHDPAADEVGQVLAARPGGLTADAAAEHARRAAPSVAVAEADLAASLARNRQTLSRYVPRLTAQASYLRKNPLVFDFSGGGSTVGALNPGAVQIGPCPGGAGQCALDSGGVPLLAVPGQPFVIPVNNYTLQADLSVPLSDYVLALPPARTAAAADEQAARLRRQAELHTVGTNARIAFYDWLRARAQLALARRSLASAQARLADARAGAKAGAVAPADVLAIEALVAGARTAIAQAEGFERLAAQALVVATRWPGPLEVGEDVLQPAPQVPELGALDALIARGQAGRPEARALVAAAAATGHAARGLAVTKLPRLDGVANVTHANPNQAFFPPTNVWNTSWFVGVALRWQLDLFLNARAQESELDATLQSLQAQHAAVLRAIELEVRGAWEDWQRAEAALRLSDAELQASEATYRQRAILFRGGEATSTELTEAEVQRHNATLRLVGARIDQRIAHARMRRAAALLEDEASAPAPAGAARP